MRANRAPVKHILCRAQALLLVFLAAALLYRGRQLWLLYHSDVLPLWIETNRPWSWYLFSFLLNDAVTGLALVAALLPVVALAAWRPLLSDVVLTVTLLLLGFHLAAYLQVLFSLHSGLTAEVLTEAWGAFPLDLVLPHVGVWEAALILLPPVGYLVWVRLAPERVSLGFRTLGLVLLGIVLPSAAIHGYALAHDPSFIYVPLARYTHYAAVEIARNPVAFTAGDVWQALARPPVRRTLPGQAQLGSVRLIDPAFTSARQPPAVARRPASSAGPAWNVVLVILESVGAEYVSDTGGGLPAPMPFLRGIAAQSLELTKHHASANSSVRALFSIFTGLYPQPTRRVFETLPDLQIPTMNTVLGEHYDSWLVTPGRLDWYFPAPLLRANGFELTGYHTLPEDELASRTEYGRSEVTGMNHFLARLRSARAPFFAVYYSFIPHYPYYDFGSRYRIRPDTLDRRARYYGNLRLLDEQLRRLFDELARLELERRTVVLIVGDHGEAFGQHPGNFGHALYGYQENYRVPAMFYQRDLFPPGKVGFPTSHVDLLPTLVDALGGDPDTLAVQGETVLAGTPARKQIFAYGSDHSLAGIDSGGRKVLLSLKTGRCALWDLRVDPAEQAMSSCVAAPEQAGAVRMFAGYQAGVLRRYNAQLPANLAGSGPGQ